MSGYKGTPRRIRDQCVSWPDIQEQQVERNLSNRKLAKILGVQPPYISRRNNDALFSRESHVLLTRRQVLRLRDAGFHFAVCDSPVDATALAQMWQSLLAIPRRVSEQDNMADSLSRFPWGDLLLEIDANPGDKIHARELPECLVSLRRQVGVERWSIVAHSIGIGIVHALESQKPSPCTRELILRLLERDLRNPLVLFPSSWEHSVVAGESIFAGLQSLAAKSHIEGRGCPVRIALDAWPGYIPLWAARQELRHHGISILFIEDSTTKMRLLAEGHVDLVGTTPGGILLRNSSLELHDLRVLAILNRSTGADLILHRQPTKPIRNPAQRPRAAFASGSTSELLFRAFSRHSTSDSQIFPVAMQGYLPTAQALLRDDLVHYVSIWEPYGTLLRDMDPSLEVIASTSLQGFDLVADYLVSTRERTGEPLLEAVAMLLRIWDRVISRREYTNQPFIDQFAHDCAISAAACKQMLGLVSFFTTRQMAWRFRNERFLTQFKNIAQVAGYTDSAAETAWRELLEPAPIWMRANLRCAIK